jgi:hypothetical protein
LQLFFANHRWIATNVRSVRGESIVRRIWFFLAFALGLSGLAGVVAVTRKLEAEPAHAKQPTTTGQQQADVGKIGIWQPPSGLKQIPIWPNGAPDMEGVSQPAERVELTKAPDVVAGHPYTVVYDVTSPTMTVFPSKGKNTGASMVVFPGGGFQLLAMDLEGTEICDSQRHYMRLAQVSRSQKQSLLGQGLRLRHHTQGSPRTSGRAKNNQARSGQGEGVEPRSQQDWSDRLLGRRLSGRADQQHIRAYLQTG